MKFSVVSYDHYFLFETQVDIVRQIEIIASEYEKLIGALQIGLAARGLDQFIKNAHLTRKIALNHNERVHLNLSEPLLLKI